MELVYHIFLLHVLLNVLRWDDLVLNIIHFCGKGVPCSRAKINIVLIILPLSGTRGVAPCSLQAFNHLYNFEHLNELKIISVLRAPQNTGLILTPVKCFSGSD